VIRVVAILMMLAAAARAEPAGDAVALLPLDAERSLEIYGQPVASEIARALVAGNVQVVVVGPKMAVPERAKLIIDGTIAAKASAVTIALRVRTTADGRVIDTLSATAPGLAKIDGAAADLAARVLPLVRDRLAALHPAEDHGKVHAGEPPRAATPDRPMLVATTTVRAPDQALRAALDAALAPWAAAHHRAVQPVDAARLDGKLGPIAVTAAHGDLAVGFWILAYDPEPGPVPLARARVRVRISDARAVLFDRVVVTDTVVGDKGLAADALAARVARELLAILRPHLARTVPAWE
jgi:hypothetical protein